VRLAARLCTVLLLLLLPSLLRMHMPRVMDVA
jgi:hypothetical protein